MENFLRKTLAFIILLFAIVTLFMSSSVILDLFNIREMEGNYVLFVVWANFVSSLLYLLAAYWLLKRKRQSSFLLLITAIILIAAYIGLKSHINAGGIYEEKTVVALIVRFTLSMAFAAASFILLKTKKQIKNENT